MRNVALAFVLMFVVGCGSPSPGKDGGGGGGTGATGGGAGGSAGGGEGGGAGGGAGGGLGDGASLPLPLASPTPLRVFFVDSVRGDDSRSDLQAQSLTTPWKSLTRAFPALIPGDEVRLRGDQNNIYVPAGGVITTSLAGNNNDLVFREPPMPSGALPSISYVAPSADGPLSVAVNAGDIVVTLAQSGGVITSTANDVLAAINGNGGGWFVASLAPGNDGTGVVAPLTRVTVVAQKSHVLTASGTQQTPITLRGNPGDPKPIVRPRAGGPNLVPNANGAADDWYALNLSSVSYVRINGLIFEKSSGDRSSNLYFAGSTRNCELSDSVSRNAHYQSITADDTTQRIHLLRNISHNNGDGLANMQQQHGMYIQGGPHLIANNIIHHHPYGFGIQIYPQANGTIIVNNTVLRSGKSGIVLGGSGGVTGIQVVNNIFAFSGEYGLAHDSTNPTLCVARQNILYLNTSGDQQPGFSGVDFSGGNPNVDPQLVDEPNLDYRPKATSPAVSGAAKEFAPGVDQLGNGRDQNPDIGALEYR